MFELDYDAGHTAIEVLKYDALQVLNKPPGPDGEIELSGARAPLKGPCRHRAPLRTLMRCCGGTRLAPRVTVTGER